MPTTILSIVSIIVVQIDLWKEQTFGRVKNTHFFILAVDVFLLDLGVLLSLDASSSSFSLFTGSLVFTAPSFSVFLGSVPSFSTFLGTVPSFSVFLGTRGSLWLSTGSGVFEVSELTALENRQKWMQGHAARTKDNSKSMLNCKQSLEPNHTHSARLA